MHGNRLVVGNELVLCKAHGVQRLAKFCAPTPVYNADRDVIGYSYSCNPGTLCASARGERNTAVDEPAVADAPSPVPQSGDSRITSDALNQLETSGMRPTFSTQAGGPRAPARYYDLTSNTSRGEQRPKKVCWSCGMDNHEKPQCRNQLCKRCHGLNTPAVHTGSYAYNSAGHICVDIMPSPFILLAELSDDELKFARCPACHEYGHLDCSTPPSLPDHAVSCCHCGEAGHHGFDCPQQQYPDRWVHCVLAVGRNLGISNHNSRANVISLPVPAPQYDSRRRSREDDFVDEVRERARQRRDPHSDREPYQHRAQGTSFDRGDRPSARSDYYRQQQPQHFRVDQRQQRSYDNQSFVRPIARRMEERPQRARQGRRHNDSDSDGDTMQF